MANNYNNNNNNNHLFEMQPLKARFREQKYRSTQLNVNKYIEKKQRKKTVSNSIYKKKKRTKKRKENIKSSLAKRDVWYQEDRIVWPGAQRKHSISRQSDKYHCRAHCTRDNCQTQAGSRPRYAYSRHT